MALREPIDKSLLSLDESELDFFKSETGINDEDALKAHIHSIQAKAYEIFPYRCIWSFSFTKLKISRLPAYKHLLQLGLERKDALFLDIGCCFGNDARKAVADGFPAENVIASDLRPDFFELGLELFKSKKLPITFIPGDAFDSAFLEPVPPFYEAPGTAIPNIPSLTSLTPLHGHISAIHASSFFHLFDEDKQRELAHRLASLLSPLQGSIIFGLHVGLPEKGIRPGGKFCHSPDSWHELWDGEVFKKGTVRVDVFVKEFKREQFRDLDPSTVNLLIWSVTRL